MKEKIPKSKQTARPRMKSIEREKARGVNVNAISRVELQVPWQCRFREGRGTGHLILCFDSGIERKEGDRKETRDRTFRIGYRALKLSRCLQFLLKWRKGICDLFLLFLNLGTISDVGTVPRSPQSLFSLGGSVRLAGRRGEKRT